MTWNCYFEKTRRTDRAEDTEYKDQKASTSTESNRKELENVSSTEESDEATIPILDLKHYEIAKTIHYIEANDVIEKPKMKNAEAQENLQKGGFNFMVALKTLINKTSVDPKLRQLKISLRNNQKERASEELSPVSNELTEGFELLFAGGKIVIPEEFKKRVVEVLHFDHPGTTQMLTESNILLVRMRKDMRSSVVQA